jgi:hypothetical protein
MAEHTLPTRTPIRLGLLLVACLAALIASIVLQAAPANALEIRSFIAKPSLTQAGGT